MRGIERELINVVESFISNPRQLSWGKSNTTASTWWDGKDSPRLMIDLFGNNIASVYPKGTVEVNKDTLREYPTNITLSRLRALGVNVTVSKGKVYLDEKFITERG